MKLEIHQEVIKTNISYTPKEFSIANDPIVYSIFSDKLYTNKHQAVIRELVCNAYDAHVAANNLDTSITVQLPTYLEPIFRVRDYGTGLAPEVVLENTTTFFWSDKRQSNDLIGGLGLGMKSPFCYTDNYTIISYWFGVKYTFSCYKNNAIPACLPISEEPTNEPNGLEIIINTNGQDAYTWKYEARKILPWFPNIEVNDTLTEIKFTAKHSITKEWKWMIPTKETCSELNLRKGFYILQGNVLYPVNNSDIKNHDLLKDFELYNEYTGTCIIEVPIGTLSVAVSREALSIDPATFKTLGNLINAALHSIQDYYHTEIQKAPDLISALLLALELKEIIPLKHITYKGFQYPVKESFTIDLSTKTQDHIYNRELIIHQYSQESWSRRGRIPPVKYITIVEKHLHYNINQLHFVGISSAPLSKEAVKHAIPTKKGHYAYYIQYTTQEALDSLLKDCHNFPNISITDLSHLKIERAKKPKTPRSKTTFTPTKVKMLHSVNWYDYTTQPGEYYYTIPLYKGKPQLTSTIDDNDFLNLLNLFQWDRRIIGIPVTTPKYLQPTTEFATQIEPLVIDKIKEYCKTFNKTTKIIQQLTHQIYYHFTHSISLNLHPNSPLKTFLEYINRINETYQNSNLYTYLTENRILTPLHINTNSLIIAPEEKNKEFKNLCEKFDKLESLYPALPLIIKKNDYTKTLDIVNTFTINYHTRILEDYDKLVCNPKDLLSTYPTTIPTIF